MDDSEPTFSTEPSSTAMRARGFTRETSPAPCPAACGAAQTSAGIEIRNESNMGNPKAYGDFVFIEDSPSLKAVSIVVTGETWTCQRQTGRPLATLYMLL